MIQRFVQFAQWFLYIVGVVFMREKRFRFDLNRIQFQALSDAVFYAELYFCEHNSFPDRDFVRVIDDLGVQAFSCLSLMDRDRLGHFLLFLKRLVHR